MKIYIDNKEVEVCGQDTLLTELRRLGIEVPTLCHSEQHRHVASCMVCMVKNVSNGQMIPSCSTKPTEGMRIETSSEEVLDMRRLSLELLLSDHRADCEAPCTQVCAKGLDVAQLLLYYDRGETAKAKAVLMAKKEAGETVPFCDGCEKTPCEKACRRRTIDSPVAIREIIAEVEQSAIAPAIDFTSAAKLGKDQFCSRLGRYTETERERMKEIYDTHSRCLHCACEGREKCALRQLSNKAGIRSSRFGVSSALPVKEQIKVTDRLLFEPAKCIRCGLCVYNTEDGFTFQNRGFDMQVVIPENSKKNIDEEIARICPTGALFVR